MIDTGDGWMEPRELMKRLSENTIEDVAGVLFDQLVHWAKETGEPIPGEYRRLRAEVAAALRNTTNCPGWARSNP